MILSAQAQQGGGYSMLIMMVAIFAIMWYAIARFLIGTGKMFKSMAEPRSKKTKTDDAEPNGSEGNDEEAQAAAEEPTTEAPKAQTAPEEEPQPVKRRPGRPRKNPL